MDPLWNNNTSGLIFWSVSYLKEVYDNKGKEQYLEYFKKNSPLRAAASKGNADRLGFTGSDAKSAVEIIPACLLLNMALNKNMKWWKLQRKKPG